jgi:hypothetical protein
LDSPRASNRKTSTSRAVNPAGIIGQARGHRGVLSEHGIELAMARAGEREPDAEAMERRIPSTQAAQARRDGAHAARLVPVLSGPQGDVVAEPLGLLMCIRVTADVHEQAGVVHDRARLGVDAESLGETERDQALSQHVLHRLSEASQPHLSTIGSTCHDRSALRD